MSSDDPRFSDVEFDEYGYPFGPSESFECEVCGKLSDETTLIRNRTLRVCPDCTVVPCGVCDEVILGDALKLDKFDDLFCSEKCKKIAEEGW